MNRQLATFFWMHEVGADENAPMDSTMIAKYMNLSKVFIDSWKAGISQLLDEKISHEFEQTSEYQDYVTSTVYHAANIFAKQMNQTTKDFYRYTYLLLFGKDKGPRLHTFILLFGRRNFEHLIIEKVYNPFGINLC